MGGPRKDCWGLYRLVKRAATFRRQKNGEGGARKWGDFCWARHYLVGPGNGLVEPASGIPPSSETNRRSSFGNSFLLIQKEGILVKRRSGGKDHFVIMGGKLRISWD